MNQTRFAGLIPGVYVSRKLHKEGFALKTRLSATMSLRAASRGVLNQILQNNAGRCYSASTLCAFRSGAVMGCVAFFAVMTVVTGCMRSYTFILLQGNGVKILSSFSSLTVFNF
jgi:hypothetical protein